MAGYNGAMKTRIGLFVFVAALLVLAACVPELPPAPTSTPFVRQTATPRPAGTSRENPLPVGAVFSTERFEIAVVDVLRPADALVAEANPFDQGPADGDEYVMVTLQVTCLREEGAQCTFTANPYTIIGPSGVVRDPDFRVIGEDGQELNRQFFGGITQERRLFFEVATTERDLVLIYRANQFASPVYLALPGV